MKKIVLLLLLALSLSACDNVFAADQTAAPAAASAVAAPAVVAPAVMAAPFIAAAPAAMPSWQPLPAQHDIGSILAWVMVCLVPWLGWLSSEIMPFLPGKANGWFHGIIEMFKAPTYDPTTNTVTVSLDELKAGLADIKGQLTAAPVAAAPAPINTTGA